MPPITKEMENAINRVNRSKTAFSQILSAANADSRAEVMLHLGAPEPHENYRQPVKPQAQAHAQTQPHTQTHPQAQTPEAVQFEAAKAAETATASTAAIAAERAKIAETAKASPSEQSAEPRPETVFPNQNKNLTVSEFEIVPEATAGRNPQTVRRGSPRRFGFGFTMNPIITVGRPNRGRQ
jgi:hypothetical protein